MVINLEDGRYLTHAQFIPNTPGNHRVVEVKDNRVRLIKPGSKHTFSVPHFFEVNILLHRLEAN